MGAIRRIKNLFGPSILSEDPGHGPANFAQEQAEVDQNTRSGGLLAPRLGTPLGLRPNVVNDPTVVAQLRTSADREDDGSKGMLIERERRLAQNDW